MKGVDQAGEMLILNAFPRSSHVSPRLCLPAWRGLKKMIWRLLITPRRMCINGTRPMRARARARAQLPISLVQCIQPVYSCLLWVELVYEGDLFVYLEKTSNNGRQA